MKQLLLVFLTGAPAVYARIGETLDQSIARYGQPITHLTGEDTYLFDKDGIAIRASFIDGVCERIEYTADDERRKKLLWLNDDEINGFKQIECFPNQTWQFDSTTRDDTLNEKKDNYKVINDPDYRMATVWKYGEGTVDIDTGVSFWTRKWDTEVAGMSKKGF